MAGEKARAATEGIREMIFECQSRGPIGSRAWFDLLLVRFDSTAEVYPLPGGGAVDRVPIREVDAAQIEIAGTGGRTDITAALRLVFDRLRPYVRGLRNHPQRPKHPLPLTAEQVCHGLDLVCNAWLEQLRGTTRLQNRSDVIRYHQRRNRAARQSRQRRQRGLPAEYMRPAARATRSRQPRRNQRQHGRLP
jgi:hypothetical protein